MPTRTAVSMISSGGPANYETIDTLKTELTVGVDGPDWLERARTVRASAGVADETVFIGYWTRAAAQRRWLERSEAVGWPGVMVETAIIPAKRWETLHSTPEMTPGMRNLVDIALTDEHEYWGAARNRIPASRTSDLAAEPGLAVPGNLCLIRSGQVWRDCGEAERSLYFRDVEPRLQEGVNFLIEHPETGCLSGRLLREQTLEGEDLESTSFVGWFRDLASLEQWSRSHPTHLAIYHSFWSMAQALGGRVNLRLWHEVAVVPPGFVMFAGTELSPLA